MGEQKAQVEPEMAEFFPAFFRGCRTIEQKKTTTKRSATLEVNGLFCWAYWLNSDDEDEDIQYMLMDSWLRADLMLLVDLVDRDDGTVSFPQDDMCNLPTRHYKLQDHVFESCLMASSKSGEKL